MAPSPTALRKGKSRDVGRNVQLGKKEHPAEGLLPEELYVKRNRRNSIVLNA